MIYPSALNPKGELAKLAKWADPAIVDAAARSLYPLEELMDHDLLGFDSTRLFHDGKFEKALERGVTNMKYNGSIGASPFIYIYNLMQNDIQEKNERYVEAFSSLWANVPSDVWINTSSFWKYKPGEYYQRTPESLALINSDPDAAIIKGYPPALSIVGIPVNPNSSFSGQAGPYVSKIVGAMKDRAVVVLRAPYPTSLYTKNPGKHDEPFTVGRDGSLIFLA